MIKVGCDLVYMPRLEKHINDELWVRKILTEAEYNQFKELSHSRRKLEYFSGRFAAKEAYVKALGVGIGVIGFHEFEVLSLESGAPYSDLASVSISHDNDYAMAVVLYEEKV